MRIKGFILFILLFFLFSSPFQAQNIYKGRVVDVKTQKPLEFVNIGVIGKNIGTCSLSSGLYQLNLSDIETEDTLVFSLIGYISDTIVVGDYKQKYKSRVGIIFLFPLVLPFQEKLYSDEEMSSKVIGNRHNSKSKKIGFENEHLGAEIGIKISIKETPSYLSDLHLGILQPPSVKSFLRINMYYLVDGMPKDQILDENIIIEINPGQNIVALDLMAYHIVVEEDIVVTIECIDKTLLDEGSEILLAGGKGPLFKRDVSHGKWKKQGGSGLGINVTAIY